jgi:PadR family transcriptional regulator, regulatory protein AphA
MTRSLSTTGYAVLGLLALRPLTAYELTQQMQRSLDYCWPTSERSLYDQPERLVQAGLAGVVDDEGRRRYSITDAGRDALRAWLATPTAMPRLQNEPLLRTLFADQGSLADLQRTLNDLRAHIDHRRRLGVEQLQTYLDDDGLFQERAHIVIVVGDLIARTLRALDDWADEVESLSADWPATTDIGLTPELRRHLEGLLAEEHSRLARRESPADRTRTTT